MRILFVHGAYESLGIEYLSAVLKKNGHQVFLAYSPLLFRDALLHFPLAAHCFNRDRSLVELENIKPDLIAFSCVTACFSWMHGLARAYKRKLPDVPIVFGGIHASTAPEYLISIPEIDFVCLGEGEQALLELVECLAEKQDPSRISNIWGKNFRNQPRPLIRDLDSLPFPDHELFYEKAPYFKDVYPIITSRGCPYSCTYCNNNSLKRIYPAEPGMLRRRSIANVMEELVRAQKKWNYKALVIEDEIFTGDTERVREFCTAYRKKIRLPFICVTHPKTTRPEELEMLRSAGCVQIEIGVQTLNRKVRRQYLRRFETNSEIVQALKALHESGIPYNIDHILGLPGDDFQSQLLALKIYNVFRPHRLLPFFITYYPGTEISGIAEKMGMLEPGLKAKILAGESESFEQHGSIEDRNQRKRLDSLRIVFGWLPLLPRKIVRLILKSSLIGMLPDSHLIGKVLPSLLFTLFSKEPRGKLILKKYLYHLIRLGK
ncbi:MAG: radical SAM protein [Candidatus Wallbacteria bacterium]|nr:radical SAM protein [Candidatus Wallbacteria bacterium]